MRVCVIAICHLWFLLFQAALDLCDPNPCQQGAPCHSVGGTYMCTCPEGYQGNECVSLKSPCTGQHCSGNERFDFFFNPSIFFQIFLSNPIFPSFRVQAPCPTRHTERSASTSSSSARWLWRRCAAVPVASS